MMYVIWTVGGLCLSTLKGSSATLVPKLARKLSPGGPRLVFCYRGLSIQQGSLNIVTVAWHLLVKPDSVRTQDISTGLLATALGGNTDMLEEADASDPSL